MSFSSIAKAAAATAFLAASIASPASHAMTITIAPSLAPNVYGSPSWSGYVSNAMTALRTGVSEIGDFETDPTAYARVEEISIVDLFVTSFASWRGEADPEAPFENEHGTRLHMGMAIDGEGAQFSLHDVSYNFDSTDPWDALDYAGNFSSSDYASHRIGVRVGTDGILNTADDIIIDSGSGSQLVDALYYVGAGNAFWPTPEPGESNQDAINRTWSEIPTSFDINMSYSVGDGAGGILASATESVDVEVPLPGTLALAAAGLGALGLTTRRRCH